MTGSTRDYQSAIQMLNSLQSNAQTIAKMNYKANNLNSLPEMRKYLQRIGYMPQDLNRLSFVHVAGTKGKGSTCAFVSSILNQFSMNGKKIKTGLYSSPHLLEVRERIRIDGEPISKDKFAKYFFNVWDKLETSNAEKGNEHIDKPAYFRYMTLVSFHAFMEENVDAVILEVGIGGEYDCTNVIDKPTVTGISSLGLDHQALLGETIEEIAWHKAGIMKKNCAAISVPQHPGAMSVIQNRVQELGPSTFVALSDRDVEAIGSNNLSLAGDHQKVNAALAKALCLDWIQIKRKEGCAIEPIEKNNDEDALKQGLQAASWPGRCQVLTSLAYKNVTWYLDGAHTRESLEACSLWFSSVARPNASKALIFNCTHQRNGKKLFPGIIEPFLASQISLDLVVFTTNDPFSGPATSKGDLVNNMVDPDPTQKTQKDLLEIFVELARESGLEFGETVIAKSVEDALDVVSKHGCDQVLITGSLHLVGGALTVFQSKAIEI